MCKFVLNVVNEALKGDDTHEGRGLEARDGEVDVVEEVLIQTLRQEARQIDRPSQ